MSVDFSKLTVAQKAAILLMSMPPEVSATLFNELGPQEVHHVVLEISRLPTIDHEVRTRVLDEGLSLAKTALSEDKMTSAASQSPKADDVLEKLARENPGDLAKLLQDSWLNRPELQNAHSQPLIAQTAPAEVAGDSGLVPTAVKYVSVLTSFKNTWQTARPP